MRPLLAVAIAALALAACQPSRYDGPRGGGGTYWDADAGWQDRRVARARQRNWEAQRSWDAPRGRSWAEERYRRTGEIDPADYGQSWVPRESRYGYGEP